MLSVALLASCLGELRGIDKVVMLAWRAAEPQRFASPPKRA